MEILMDSEDFLNYYAVDIPNMPACVQMAYLGLMEHYRKEHESEMRMERAMARYWEEQGYGGGVSISQTSNLCCGNIGSGNKQWRRTNELFSKFIGR